MKEATIKELKQNLAKYTEMAAAGESVYIKKYNKPYVMLSSTGSQHLLEGSKTGQSLKKSGITEGSSGRYLELLQEDRG